MAGTTNTQLLGAIHELDKKIVNHLGLITEQEKKIGELRGDVYNHNNKEEGGIKFKTKTLWNERVEKKKISLGVKIAVATSIVNGLIAAGSMLNKF